MKERHIDQWIYSQCIGNSTVHPRPVFMTLTTLCLHLIAERIYSSCAYCCQPLCAYTRPFGMIESVLDSFEYSQADLPSHLAREVQIRIRIRAR